jgi:hypothetical protein
MINNTIPFRWNIANKSELGQLLNPDYVLKKYLLEDLRLCVGKIIKYTQDCHLVFVGRSLDSAYDYLSGFYLGSKPKDYLKHLNISLYGQSIEEIGRKDPQSIEELKKHFSQLKLDPHSIKKSIHKIYFVDVVYYGGTYTEIFNFIERWSKEVNEHVSAVINKIGFIGITSRTKNSPNTWRWHQHKDWPQKLSKNGLKNISVDRGYWDYIGNTQSKLTRSNRPNNWLHKPIEKPEYDEKTLTAINEAYYLYQIAQTNEEKKLLKSLIPKLK